MYVFVCVCVWCQVIWGKEYFIHAKALVSLSPFVFLSQRTDAVEFGWVFFFGGGGGLCKGVI